MSMLNDLRADAARYIYYDDSGARPTLLRAARALAAHQGLQAIALYRFARLLRQARSRAAPVRLMVLLGRLLYPLLSRVNDVANGIWISPDAEIGPGLFIAHYGGVVIGPATIGASCNIGNSVTIGQGGRGERAGRPVIRDRVVIAVGARVLGRITVAEDAMIGANSVVTRDVEARAVMSGVPARQISRHGSFDYLRYPGMEHDDARLASIARAG
jgi:serine O-acetyltransferase